MEAWFLETLLLSKTKRGLRDCLVRCDVSAVGRSLLVGGVKSITRSRIVTQNAEGKHGGGCRYCVLSEFI